MRKQLQLTSHQSEEKAPLHSVVDIADNTVVVESANDIVDCFYTVFGERKDVERFEGGVLMSRIIFKLNNDNSVEILDTDFIEENISVQSDGDSKIIKLIIVEESMEINDMNGEI